MVAAVALSLHFAQRGRAFQRASAVAALVLVAIALALTCVEAASGRAEVDALLASAPITACDKELSRHVGYGEARANAGLALCWAPFALLVATFVLAQSLAEVSPRRRMWVGSTAPAWAMFVAVAYVYLQPLPGRLLWPGRCALYSYRDAILSADHEELRRGCYELSRLLEDPRAMAQSLGTESLAGVLPELPKLKKRCLAEMLEELRHQSSWSVSRGQTLRSPFLTPEDVRRGHEDTRRDSAHQAVGSALGRGRVALRRRPVGSSGRRSACGRERRWPGQGRAVGAGNRWTPARPRGDCLV